ncbi:MAG: phosphatidyl-myo-inositol alpha-mannosyltransferase, partial [Actinomycetota bacterium]
MTRVALVHPFSWPAVRRGGERYLHDLAWYLTSQGASVDMVVGGRRFAVESHDGARLVRLRHPRRLDVRGLSRLDTFGAPAMGWLARHRYDVVHALTPTAAIAAVATGQRTVYTALGHPTPETIGRRRLDPALFRTTVRRSAAPLALSNSAADSIETITGVRPEVVPPGLRTDRFPLRDAPRTGAPTVLFPAYAEDRRKGLDVLLAAFAAVLDHRPDTRLQLGGGGDAQWAFDTLDPSSRDRVAAATDLLGAGELDDVADYYARATLTVLPSINEAFGLVLVESLASGTPVVGVASGGPTEIVDDKRIGRLAAPRDPASLAAAILEVVTMAADPATPARCAQHSRRWDWAENVGPLHLDVYRNA